MHLGDQRAGGIEHLETPFCGLVLHGLGDVVGAEDDDDVIGNLMQLVNKHRAAVTQVLYDELVVHHFMAHIDRWTEYFQRSVDDFDSPVNAGTEAAWIGQFDLHEVNLRMSGLSWQCLKNFIQLSVEGEQFDVVTDDVGIQKMLNASHHAVLSEFLPGRPGTSWSLPACP